MTGPHLTPEREAEIRDLIPRRGGRRLSDGSVTYRVPTWDDLSLLLVALDVEREALNQARTALDDSSVLLVRIGLRLRVLAPHLDLIGRIDAQVQANQVARGLAVAEADKPHDGNER